MSAMADDKETMAGCPCRPAECEAYLVPAECEAEAVLPLIKGDPFRYEDFTDEQLADLRRPAVEAAMVAGRASANADRAAADASSAAVAARGAAAGAIETETAVAEAEAGRERAETKRAEAEEKRATEFEGFSDIIKGLDPTLAKEALRKVPQALTPEEQAQVKANLNISKMELFCDLFNAAAGDAGYARMVNGVFDCELNKLKLTYEEAVAVYASCHKGTDQSGALAAWPVRTNIPVRIKWDAVISRYAQGNTHVEVLNLPVGIMGDNAVNSFYGCTNLREVRGLSHLGGRLVSGLFYGCARLVFLEIDSLQADLDLRWSPLLSADSLERVITNAANTAPITITVHPDVFAKLTDEANAEWHQVLLDAANKDITFATV